MRAALRSFEYFWWSSGSRLAESGEESGPFVYLASSDSLAFLIALPAVVRCCFAFETEQLGIRAISYS